MLCIINSITCLSNNINPLSYHRCQADGHGHRVDGNRIAAGLHRIRPDERRPTGFQPHHCNVLSNMLRWLIITLRTVWLEDQTNNDNYMGDGFQLRMFGAENSRCTHATRPNTHTTALDLRSCRLPRY